MMVKRVKIKKQRPTINYSQCWEDTRLLLDALCIESADSVLSIGSGGDNSLAILAKKPKSLTVIDQNEHQIFLFELKHQSLLALNKKEVLAFFGYRPYKNRVGLYRKVSGRLSKSCRRFWDTHPKLIEKGINHIGKFERFLSAFRDYILPLAHSKYRRNLLLEEKPPMEQELFYQKTWNNKRWNLLFHLFFSERRIKNRGRSQGMFDHNTRQNVAVHYKNKTRQALTKPTLFNNSYLEYIFQAKYTPTLPDFLNNGSSECIKNCPAKVKIRTNNLVDFLKETPDNSFSKFNLSDVFEPMSSEETTAVFHEIMRVAQPGARLIFWNNLVNRDVPPEISSKFEQQEDLENKLKDKERVFFYNCFRIYKVLK